jgi:broad specificity phosphatase PhoE
LIDLILVRHGETAWNASRRFQGRTDIPLSEIGRAQARAVSLRLQGEPFNRCYASDLDRATETARIIVEPRGMAVTIEPRIREFDFGEWEGLTWDEIVARWPDVQAYGSTAARLYHPQGGESFDAVCARVASFVADLRLCGDARVLAVTHAGVLHALFEVFGDTLEGRGPEPIRFAHASVTHIAIEPKRARIVTLNDVSHLRQ